MVPSLTTLFKLIIIDNHSLLQKNWRSGQSSKLRGIKLAALQSSGVFDHRSSRQYIQACLRLALGTALGSLLAEINRKRR